MLPLHQAAFSLSWLTPGLEPCSSVAQTDALPNKLKPTSLFDTGLRFELRIPDSKSDVLPITLSGSIRRPGQIRTDTS